MKRILNLVTSRPDANNPDKRRWQQHGILILGTNSQGEERISIKLNSLPIAADFDGWFSAFDRILDREDEPRSRHSNPVPNTDTDFEYDDSIPFPSTNRSYNHEIV